MDKDQTSSMHKLPLRYGRRDLKDLNILFVKVGEIGLKEMERMDL